MGLEIILDLNWIDECTYELKPKKLIKGDPSIMINPRTLRTAIRNVTKGAYEAESTMEGTDQSMFYHVEIIDGKP